MKPTLATPPALADLMRRARRNGEVRIVDEDGRAYVLRPEAPNASPLDVPGLELGLRTSEILEAIREARRP